MTTFNQLDIACRDPKLIAEWYEKLLGAEATPLGPDAFAIPLDQGQLHFCPREAAGVASDAGGVHQLNLTTARDFSSIRSVAEATNCKAESVSFGDGPPQLCVWDPEGNPVVFHASKSDV